MYRKNIVRTVYIPSATVTEFQISVLTDTQPPLLLTTMLTVCNMESFRKMFVSFVNRGLYTKTNTAVKGRDKSNRNVTSGWQPALLIAL